METGALCCTSPETGKHFSALLVALVSTNLFSQLKDQMPAIAADLLACIRVPALSAPRQSALGVCHSWLLNRRDRASGET